MRRDIYGSGNGKVGMDRVPLIQKCGSKLINLPENAQKNKSPKSNLRSKLGLHANTLATRNS